MLKDLEIKRREDIGQAQRAGRMAAAGVLQHPDYIYPDLIGFLLDIRYGVIFLSFCHLGYDYILNPLCRTCFFSDAGQRPEGLLRIIGILQKAADIEYINTSEGQL
jgi:hypothetical protein